MKIFEGRNPKIMLDKIFTKMYYYIVTKRDEENECLG